MQVARTVGMATARIAEANRDLVIRTLMQPGDTERDLALRFAAAAEHMLPLFEPTLSYAFRAHMLEQIRRDVIGAGDIASGQPGTATDVSRLLRRPGRLHQARRAGRDRRAGPDRRPPRRAGDRGGRAAGAAGQADRRRGDARLHRRRGDGRGGAADGRGGRRRRRRVPAPARRHRPRLGPRPGRRLLRPPGQPRQPPHRRSPNPAASCSTPPQRRRRARASTTPTPARNASRASTPAPSSSAPAAKSPNSAKSARRCLREGRARHRLKPLGAYGCPKAPSRTAGRSLGAGSAAAWCRDASAVAGARVRSRCDRASHCDRSLASALAWRLRGRPTRSEPEGALDGGCAGCGAEALAEPPQRGGAVGSGAEFPECEIDVVVPVGTVRGAGLASVCTDERISGRSTAARVAGCPSPIRSRRWSIWPRARPNGRWNGRSTRRIVSIWSIPKPCAQTVGLATAGPAWPALRRLLGCDALTDTGLERKFLAIVRAAEPAAARDAGLGQRLSRRLLLARPWAGRRGRWLALSPHARGAGDRSSSRPGARGGWADHAALREEQIRYEPDEVKRTLAAVVSRSASQR